MTTNRKFVRLTWYCVFAAKFRCTCWASGGMQAKDRRRNKVCFCCIWRSSHEQGADNFKWSLEIGGGCRVYSFVYICIWICTWIWGTIVGLAGSSPSYNVRWSDLYVKIRYRSGVAWQFIIIHFQMKLTSMWRYVLLLHAVNDYYCICWVQHKVQSSLD